jgi:ABC-type enterochelin transport system permease subunit
MKTQNTFRTPRKKDTYNDAKLSLVMSIVLFVIAGLLQYFIGNEAAIVFILFYVVFVITLIKIKQSK